MAYRGADPTDVMGRRIGAYLLDGLITAVVVGGVAAALFFGALQSAPAGTIACPDDTGVRGPGTAAICIEDGDRVRYLDDDGFDRYVGQIWVLSAAFSVVTNVLLQGLTGATPGKHLVGLRVVRSDGHNAGLLRCLVRTVLLVVDSACCAIVGLLTAFRSRGHRRVGDMVAGTIVISRRDRDALILARSGIELPDRASLAAAAWTEAAPAPAPVGGPAVAPVAAVPGVDAPTWDQERGAYIQYDRELAAWMQWSDEAGAWRPI